MEDKEKTGFIILRHVNSEDTNRYWMDSLEALDFDPMEEESNLVITKLMPWISQSENIVLYFLVLLHLASH